MEGLGRQSGIGGKWMEVWGVTNGEDVPRRVKGLKDYRESQQNGRGVETWGVGGWVERKSGHKCKK